MHCAHICRTSAYPKGDVAMCSHALSRAIMCPHVLVLPCDAVLTIDDELNLVQGDVAAAVSTVASGVGQEVEGDGRR